MRSAICVVSSLKSIHSVKSAHKERTLDLAHLTLLISFPSFSLFFLSDLLSGAQEKCELPPLDGFPHCEGKLKVNHRSSPSHLLTVSVTRNRPSHKIQEKVYSRKRGFQKRENKAALNTWNIYSKQSAVDSLIRRCILGFSLNQIVTLCKKKKTL